MFEFKMNNRTWHIEELSQQEIRDDFKNHCEKAFPEGRYYGVTWQDAQKIYLDKELCDEQKRITLLHELAHCYVDCYITHIDKEYTSEELADAISFSHDIIRKIVDEYFGDKK